MSDQEDIYTVVLNIEEQYSIWPTFKNVPSGWQEIGVKGSKDFCLEHIKEVWKDMRPLSLRKKMDERKNAWEEKKQSTLSSSIMKPLQSRTVSFLTQGWHPISCKSIYNSCQDVREAIAKHHFHLTFLDTEGQTCLSMTLNPQKTLLEEADFETGTGMIQLEGNLTLDFVKVKCLARITLPSLEGEGTLEKIN